MLPARDSVPVLPTRDSVPVLTTRDSIPVLPTRDSVPVLPGLVLALELVSAPLGSVARQWQLMAKLLPTLAVPGQH